MTGSRRARRSGARPTRRPSARLALALLLTGLWSCGELDLGRPNLLVIVIDCLRADHVGFAGYARDTTPGLDALAAEGVYFSHAFSPSYWTRPSVPSLLTGLYPSEHGLMELERDTTGAVVGPVLAPEVETVAESLQTAGYATALVGEQYQLSRLFGLDQGFEYYNNKAGKAGAIGARFLEWLDRAAEAADDRPFFAYLHYLDIHWPYCPPQRTRGTFDPGRSELSFCGNWRQLRERIRSGELQLTADDVESMKARYDEELLALDGNLRGLFQSLQQRGLWDDTLVVITADHGEEFLERGGIGHQGGLWDYLISVPLLVKPPAAWPGEHGRRVDAMVESRELAQLLRAAAGAIPQKKAGTLLPLVLGAAGPGRELVVAESLDSVAVRTERWKLQQPRDGSAPSLYDLETDPGERRDLAAEQPAEVARLQAALRAWARERRAAAVEHGLLDEESRQGLEALGYLD